MMSPCGTLPTSHSRNWNWKFGGNSALYSRPRRRSADFMSSGVNRRVLPGLGIGLGYAVVYLSLLVLVPLAACLFKAASLGPREFLAAAWTPRAQAAYALTFGVALIAAIINVLLGTVVAWTLVRYPFPGKRIVDALVDIPLALPTAVAGLVFASLYVPQGWIGQFLTPLGIQVAYT